MTAFAGDTTSFLGESPDFTAAAFGGNGFSDPVLFFMAFVVFDNARAFLRIPFSGACIGFADGLRVLSFRLRRAVGGIGGGFGLAAP